MRTKDITDCFEIGWLVGFSITIRIIQCLCVPITDTGTAAQVIKPCDRRAACWFGERIAGPGDYPPYPWGGGKTGGVFLAEVGYISQPFETTSSKQRVQEKQGGMIFERVCKK